MADNIKIVGEILNTQQVSRYDEADLNLLSPQTLKKDFGQQNDYIEYFVYDAGNNLLNTDYSYNNFKSPNTSFVNPVTLALPIIEIDPVKDLQNLGYSSGEFIVQYNIFTNRISDSSAELFLKEISADRTELRVGSTILTNQQIESGSLALINEASGSSYFIEYLLNFGDNTQVVAVNVALNKVESGYEILFKLYQPLPDTIQEKSTLWIVDEKSNPYIFDINLDKLIIPAPGPQLRGPNFSIDIPNQNNIATSYQTYNSLVNSLQNVSSSYQQLLSLITSQSIDINTDYTDFTNFIFFSSAKQRVINFYNKVKQIEDYKNNIATYIPLTSSRPNLIYDLNLATASINDTITNFDGFEYYLYFESGSTLTSSLESGITPYPKSSSLKPFTLYSTGSSLVNTWYNAATSKADYYDNCNQNNLIYTVPLFIIEDENNNQYITFLNMVGHYFDNIWIFLNAITDINLANNNLERGISKDLVYTTLQSLGIKLYNKYGDSSDDLFLIGNNSGSVNFDNNFTPTGSYLNNIPRKDLLAETYKRIYHNLPLLLKTKGTTYGLQTLISTFGITSSILNVKEYGGDLKSQTLDEYNNDKVRIVNNTITGSILSPFISLLEQPTSSLLFRTDDLHYVDISFSPETQIDTYASASISTANPTWSLDDYIGDPRQIYSGSYNDLNIQRNTYYNFTSSYMDYAGFIRLIQFFDNSLFKMIKDFVPARTSLSTGITISSPILERNKWVYANPSSTDEIEIMDVNLEGPTITTEYTSLYQGLTGSRAAYYTGEFSGSVIEYGDNWIERNFNPYLQWPTSSLTIQERNIFNHSEFNVLLNNVSSSLLSQNRRLLQPIYVRNSPLRLAGYSSSYFAELQDTNESLTTYNRARYEGAKVSSLLYSVYTSASANYIGDSSYGKTAAINKDVRQIGLFTEIVSSSLLPGRNRVSLKYLVDEFGDLTELNQRNKNWEDVQRTFIAGDYLNVSQFDNQKSSNQKSTDGNKLIFDSGYSYNPILYFPQCLNQEGYKNLSFQNLGDPSSYLATANNLTASDAYYITGSGVSIGFPLSASYITNLFNNQIQDDSNVFQPGTLLSFCSYSVAETGQYKIYGTVNLTATAPSNQSTTWSLELYSGSTLINSNTQQAFFGDITENCTSYTVYNESTSTNIRFRYTDCSTGNILNVQVNPNFGSGGNTATVCSRTYPEVYEGVTEDWYVVDGLTCGIPYTVPGSTTQTFSLTIDEGYNNTNYRNLLLNDKLSLRLKHVSSTNLGNMTIFLNPGFMSIGSLSVSTGYSVIDCPYIYSTTTSSITFTNQLTSFYSNNYIFTPNPETGSISALYDTYGDVDYPFLPKPYDILILQLSDNTTLEYTILNVYKDTNNRLTIDLNKQLSSTVRDEMDSPYEVKKFLILSRLKDETSTYLTFKKRAGSTSYGFIIPQNIAADVLANIDTITKEVKQKLLSDQSQITINTF